ncbi:MAG TPA: SseB family protein [Candidatus Angelobacter sp.]|jgi:hypothetical protein
MTCIRREDDAEHSSTASAAAQPGRSDAQQPPQFENSPLPAAMLAVANDDTDANRRALYESMFASWFLVPTRNTPSPGAPGFHELQEDMADSFMLENDSAGQVVAVAFTDEEALRNWNKNIPWIALKGTDFFQAVLSTEAEEIVINPFEPEDPGSKLIRPAGRITRWEFEWLAQGLSPQDYLDDDTEPQPESSQSVLVTMPKQMPSAEIFQALSESAQTFPEISGMYFAQLIYSEGPHHTVAMEFAPDVSEQQIEDTMVAMEKEARRLFPEKEKIDLLHASTALGQSIAKSGKKFYSAKK